MIKYYYVPELKWYDYQYHRMTLGIQEFYLIKSGWIRCYDYKEDENDSYYIADSYGTPTNRTEYCLKRDNKIDLRMFDNLEQAKTFALKELENFYKEESLQLLNAYNECVKNIEEIK